MGKSHRVLEDPNSLIGGAQQYVRSMESRISDKDMEYQLRILHIQELDIMKKLNRNSKLEIMNQLKDWEEITRNYLFDLSSGLECQKIALQDDDERKRDLK